VSKFRAIASGLILLLAAAGSTGHAARAEDDPAALQKKLQKLEKSIESDRARADRLAAEAVEQASQLDTLRAEMQAAARAVQSHENALSGLERERAALRDETAAKRVTLDERRAQLGSTLAAIQRIALRPGAALLVTLGDPNDIVRSGLLIRAAIPQIETRAASLRVELDELAVLDAQLGENRRDLAAAAAALVEEQGRIAALVDRKNEVLGETRAEQEAAAARVERLAREARTIGDLLEALMRRGEMEAAIPVPRPARPGLPGAAANPTLSAQPPTAGGAPEEVQQATAVPAPRPGGAAVSKSRGRLTPPAQGELLVGFGDRNAFGATARGVTWRVRPAASVLAPWDGRVVFAGPFRHFGRILIIDHGEGYHSLIAGLDRIDARAGQWVLAGEPVGSATAGLTGAADTGKDNSGSVTDGRGAGGNRGGGADADPGDRAEGPTVYVEFRRNGEPINPLPWLAASLDRTNG
jgi:murein hydrolase activator